MNDEGIEMVADLYPSRIPTFGRRNQAMAQSKTKPTLGWFVRIPALILAVFVGIPMIIL